MARGRARLALAVLLSAATVSAAAWWAISVVHYPASLRRTLGRGLLEYFPGGVEFQGASRIGPSTYRVIEVRAFAPGSDVPWLSAAVMELKQSADGRRLERVSLGAPVLRLGAGPSLLPESALRVPDGGGPLPELEAVHGTILVSVPGWSTLPVPVLTDLSLRFRPGSPVEGSCRTPLGDFRLQGDCDPPARCTVRAGSDRVEIAADSPLRTLVALDAKGAASAAFSLSFGGGEPVVLSGNLSMQEVHLGGAEVRFSGVRAVLAGREGPGGFNLTSKVHAARASTGGITAEGVVLSMPWLSPEYLSGEAALWKGRLSFRGSAAPAVRIEGTVKGADLALMPPGFLGAATPAGGSMDVEFKLEGGRLEGIFDAADARLWGVPVLHGIRRLVPGFGLQEGGFRTVKGRFCTERDETVLPEVTLEGAGFQLSLSKPGKVGPSRKLDLDFELRLQRGERGEEAVLPLRTLVDAVGRALWKPIGKFFLFHVKIGGTLDAPTHELVAPLGLGK